MDDSVSYFWDRFSLARDSRGRFVLGPRWPTRLGEHALDLYDKSGTRLKSFAPDGSGPREFNGLYAFAQIAADTIVVFSETETGLLTTDGEVVREWGRVPGRVKSAAPGAVGEVVVASAISNGRQANTLQVISLLDGRVVRVEAPAAPAESALAAEADWTRIIGSSADGRTWAARLNEYRIERWSPRGTLERTLTRDASWFPAWQSPVRRGSRSVRTIEPRIIGVSEDNEGLLWVNILVPSNRRRVDEQTGQIGNIAAAGVFDSIFDTIIDVIDPRAGVLVASARFEGALRGMFDGMLVARFVANSDDAPTVSVFEVRLVRP